MVRSESVYLDVKLPPEAVYTELYLFLSATQVEPGEAFLLYGQLINELGVGINNADVEVYLDGVYDSTVKTSIVIIEGEEIHGYYSQTYIISEVNKYKFQTKFKATQIDGVWYADSESETKIIGVGVPPEDFLLLNVRALDIDTNEELEIPFIYDTLSRKTPYKAKLSEVTDLTFVFPESERRFKFVEWEDKTTSLTRLVTISADTELIAYYEKGCFIATAAFGTPLAKELTTLRSFRDTFMFKNMVGRSLIGAYYTTSPPIARVIRKSEKLRRIVRFLVKIVINLKV